MSAPAIVVDAGDDASAWQPMPASGVKMKISSEAGPNGPALRVDFDFAKGGGFAVLHRKVSLDLPENYVFTFRMRGDCKPNNLEFKLLDESGDNVWWRNQRDVVFPREWTAQSIKKRHISYAWGPIGGGDLKHAHALEFAITAGQGGQGTVWFDDLTLQPLPPPTAAPPPILARASASLRGTTPGAAVDTLPATAWVPAPKDAAPWLELDFQTVREFGGLVVDWTPGAPGTDYVVEGAGEDGAWRTLRKVVKGDGGRDWLALGEAEARIVRLRMTGAGSKAALARVQVMPIGWASTPVDLFMTIASGAPRGSFPRSYLHEQNYWTVVGVDGDPDEGLFDEDARLETGRAQFTIEPFLRVGDRLFTWADVKSETFQQDGDLPIPSVRWKADDVELTTTAFGRGATGASSLVARYEVRNAGAEGKVVELNLAIRPFQVNPPSQFLNTVGGVAPVRELQREGDLVRVNGDRALRSLAPIDDFRCATFDQGDPVAMLRANALPATDKLVDPQESATGVMTYRLSIPAGGTREVALLIPFHGEPEAVALGDGVAARWQADVAAEWRRKLDVVQISLGGDGADVARTLRAQLGYVLVNRDGAGIQPGSRSYERSWIRDGSLTSTALLRMGLTQPVKDYLQWFAPYQYADGKVPCCVDKRGSDPVPEHDSHGEFVYLAAEYLRLTGDRATVEALWPHVRSAVAYQDTLRFQRRTAEWRTPDKAAYFGIFPPSISHEGYSSKPMHSYWDDLFALRGYKDGVWLAQQLGHPDDARWMASSRDEFAKDFAAACRAAMAQHKIAYVPGCSDLGDFDATSTTIAFNPVQADSVLPAAGVQATFERYWDFFQKRRDGVQKYVDYTPYELRTIGAFVHLGWRDRAQELMRWFFLDRRPDGWHQWAEVVDPEYRHVRFLGDMPHTWVGTDYVRSVLDMLAYERESDSALVIGAGVAASWRADSGVVVRGLRTRWGTLSYTWREEPGYRVGILDVSAEGLRVPPGGIELSFDSGRDPHPRTPGEWKDLVARVNGGRPVNARTQKVVLHSLPAHVEWTWEFLKPEKPRRSR